MGYDADLDPDYVYSHARAFSTHPDFTLEAAVDPDPELRKRFTDQYAAPAYADLTEAMALDADVLVIATPTGLHAQIIHDALKSSPPRAILCEKPLTDDVAEARELLGKCEEMKVSLFVNYIRRSDRAVIEVKRRIDSGDISGPLKAVVWYSKGFFHNGSHLFNLAEYWFGPMVRAQLIARGRKWEEHDPEPDVRVEFEKGTAHFLAAWEEAFSHYTIEVLSPSGRLRYESRGESVEWQSARADPYFKGYTTLTPEAERIPSGMTRYQWNVANELAAALKGEKFHLCTGAEALRTLESMHSIADQL